MRTFITHTRRTIIAALALALTLSACGSTPAALPPAASSAGADRSTSAPRSTDRPAATAEPTATTEPTSTVEPTVTPKPAAGISRSNPLPLGTEVRLKTWAITISNVTRGNDARQAIAKANQFNEPPRKGYEYILATMRVQNISDKPEAQHVSLGSSVRVSGDRNVLYSSASVVVPTPLEGELFPGGAVEGQQAFEIPADEHNLMFQLDESFSLDEDAQRFVALDDGARIVPDAALIATQPSEVGTRRDAPARLGETVTTDTWEVTILEVVRGDQAAKLVQEANQFNDPAPADSEYVAVKLRARLIGTQEPDVAQHIDGGYLKITGAKSVIYEKPSVVAPAPELDAYVFPGGTAEGWEVVSIAKGEQKLALIFEPLFSFSDAGVRFLALE